MTDFTVCGPYVVTTYIGKRGRLVGVHEGRVFFEECGDLAAEKGCYVFATRTGRGYKPWYVGKATKSFKQECFTHHKLYKYNECLVDMARCTPVLFFVIARGARGMTGTKHIAEAEKFLIQHAVAVNPELLNIKGTRMEGWSISGVLRSQGRASTAAGIFKNMLKVPERRR